MVLRSNVASVRPAWIETPEKKYAQPEEKRVTELATFHNPHEIDNKRFVATVKIKSIVPGQCWWYLACNACKRTLNENEGTYKCSNRDCTSTAGAPRYHLCVKVVDPEAALNDDTSASIELVFFGPTAEEIIGVPVTDLKINDPETGTLVPSKIQDLYGKVLTVRVSVGRASFDNTQVSYQVNNIVKPSHGSKEDMAVPSSEAAKTNEGTPDRTTEILSKGSDDKVPERPPCTPALTEAAQRHGIVSQSALTVPAEKEKNKGSMDAQFCQKRSIRENITDSETERARTAKRKLQFDDTSENVK